MLTIELTPVLMLRILEWADRLPKVAEDVQRAFLCELYNHDTGGYIDEKIHTLNRCGLDYLYGSLDARNRQRFMDMVTRESDGAWLDRYYKNKHTLESQRQDQTQENE